MAVYNSTSSDARIASDDPGLSTHGQMLIHPSTYAKHDIATDDAVIASKYGGRAIGMTHRTRVRK